MHLERRFCSSHFRHCRCNAAIRVTPTFSGRGNPMPIFPTKRAITLTVFVLLATLLVFSGSARAQDLSYTAATRERTTTTAQRKVFVRSKALLVKASVVEDKLMKRSEFAQMGLVLTRDPIDADIILELRHDVLTKYVYSAVDART